MTTLHESDDWIHIDPFDGESPDTPREVVLGFEEIEEAWDDDRTRLVHIGDNIYHLQTRRELNAFMSGLFLPGPPFEEPPFNV